MISKRVDRAVTVAKPSAAIVAQTNILYWQFGPKSLISLDFALHWVNMSHGSDAAQYLRDSPDLPQEIPKVLYVLYGLGNCFLFIAAKSSSQTVCGTRRSRRCRRHHHR